MNGLPPNRVVEPDPGALTEHQSEVLERLVAKRGKLLTPYKIWIHAPGVAEGMEVLGTHLNTASSLSKAELEFVVLSTAVYWQSPFVINAHTRHARTAGLSDAVIDAILKRTAPAPSGERLAAIAELTAIGLAGGGTDDATFERIAGSIGREGVAEVVALIGYYTAVALAMRLHNVQPQAE